VGIVAVCGKYRTGKSYLLNKLFKGHKAFEVGPTINPCTKGLWMMRSPVYVSEKQSHGVSPEDFEWSLEPKPNTYPVFIVDTEGLGAVDED